MLRLYVQVLHESRGLRPLLTIPFSPRIERDGDCADRQDFPALLAAYQKDNTTGHDPLKVLLKRLERRPVPPLCHLLIQIAESLVVGFARPGHWLDSKRFATPARYQVFYGASHLARYLPLQPSK